MGVWGITTAAFTPDPSDEGMPKLPCPWSINYGMFSMSNASDPSGVDVYKTLMPMMAEMGLIVRGNISAIHAPGQMTMTSACSGLPSIIARPHNELSSIIDSLGAGSAA